MFKAASILMIVALGCFAIEKTFYGYIDEQEFVRDSFFLPLSFILGGGGIALAVISFALRILKRRNSKKTG